MDPTERNLQEQTRDMSAINARITPKIIVLQVLPGMSSSERALYSIPKVKGWPRAAIFMGPGMFAVIGSSWQEGGKKKTKTEEAVKSHFRQSDSACSQRVTCTTAYWSSLTWDEQPSCLMVSLTSRRVWSSVRVAVLFILEINRYFECFPYFLTSVK